MTKRIRRSTFNAETQSMIDGVAAGLRLRTVIADIRGQIQEGGKRLELARYAIPHLWFTDCESLHSYLVNPVAANTEDKRLEIDLKDLRHYPWEDADGNPKDDMTIDQSDKVRWIDTSIMLGDPMTKMMKADRLEEALRTGILDLQPKIATQMAKVMKQRQRS